MQSHPSPGADAPDTRVKIPFGRLTAYSALQLPLAMAALPVVLNVTHFYGEVLKLNLKTIGPLLILARIIDAVQDPIIGFASDRMTKYRYGRLLLAAIMIPLLIGGFFMLFAPPDFVIERGPNGRLLNPGWLGWWLFAALFIVHLGYAGVSITYHAHGAELSDDYNERTRVTVGREVFGLTGMTLAVVLPTWLTSANMFGDVKGYWVLGLVFIPIVLLCAAPTLLYSPPTVHGEVVRKDRSGEVLALLRRIGSGLAAAFSPKPILAVATILYDFASPLKNKLFRRLLLVFVINGAALGIAVSVMLFYVEHVLKGGKLEAGLILLAYFIAGAASVPLWLWLSKRISKAGAWFVGMVLTIVAMSFALMLGEGDFKIFLAISILTGMGIGADYGLPPSILADIINAQEGKDTKGETGAYFGIWALATKVATALGAAFSIPVAAILGFNPSEGQYDTTALVIVYIALPIAVKFVAGLTIWYVRIEVERPEVRKVILGMERQ